MILTILLAAPLLGSLLTLICTKTNTVLIRRFVVILSSFAPIAIWAYVLSIFNYSIQGFQFVEQWSYGCKIFDSSILKFFIGVDSLSLSLIGLTYFLIFIIIFFVGDIRSSNSLLKISLSLFFAAFAALMFASLELFLLFIAFEACLVPIFFLINAFGGEKKNFAAFKFFIYSSFGSLLLLVAILIICFSLHSSDLRYIFENALLLDNFVKKICWLLIFVASAIKIPIPPFHTWLPYAHVQSPTIGSVLLSGVSIKMGAYLMIRLMIALLPDLTEQLSFIPTTMGLIAVIYGSMLAFSQSDIKAMIAYSSIAHMGVIVIGIFSYEKIGLSGAIFQMISHGLISPSLFLCSEIILNNAKTRNMNEVGGLLKKMPFFAFMFFILVLSSISLPGTSGFIGEYLIIASAMKKAFLNAFVASLGMFFSAAYMLNCYRKVFFGSLCDQKKELSISDFELIECIGISFFVVLIVYLGLFPNIILDFISSTVREITSY